jgi:hypothetical protein
MCRSFSVAVLATVVLVLGAGSASAADLHLGPAGADAGDCRTEAAPCQTLAYAQGRLLAGDTVHLRAGDYVTPSSGTIGAANVSYVGPQQGVPAPGRTGAEARILIPSGALGVTPAASGMTFDGVTITTQPGSSGRPTSLYGIQGTAGQLTVRDTAFDAYSVIGIVNYASGLVVSGSSFANASYGVYVTAGASVSGSRFTAGRYGIQVDTGQLTAVGNDFTAATGVGVYFPGDGTSGTLTGNRFAPALTGIQADGNALVAAANNWWGCNAGAKATGCAAATGSRVTVEPHLVLSAAATPVAVHAGDPIALSATLNRNSAGTDTGARLLGTPVTFASPVGTVVPASTVIGAGGSATANLTDLTTAGLFSASAKLDNATVPVAFAVDAPVVSPSSTTLAFGDVPRGTTSDPKTLTVTNTGVEPLDITSIARSGTGGSRFTLTQDCTTAAIAPGGQCTISAVFAPSALGALAPALTIASDGGTAVIALSGTGTGAVMSLSDSAISFGVQTVGTTSAPRSVTVANTGNRPLTLTGVARSGTGASAFSTTNTCTTAPIAPGATCTVTVLYTPTAAVTSTPTLTLTGGGLTSAIALSGTGVAPAPAAALSLDSTALAFGSVDPGATSDPQTITVRNTGTTSLRVTGVTRTGTGGSRFSVTNGCSGSLAPNATCPITVTFSPTALGTLTPALSITSNGGNATVALSGTGGGRGSRIQSR